MARFLISLVCPFVLANCQAANSLVTVPDIVVGTAEADPPTLVSLGVNRPIIAGDENYNAIAHLEYRQDGSIGWRPGLHLMRVRLEFADIDREESFAGSIFGLQAGTNYEVRINVVDPDSTDIVQILNLATRPQPPKRPQQPNVINVSNGTADNPIFIRLKSSCCFLEERKKAWLQIHGNFSSLSKIPRSNQVIQG